MPTSTDHSFIIALANTAMARPLFGGALSAAIPPSAQDISELRQIPDNQEVFANSQTDQSIIIELLEYQSHVQGAEAVRYHFDDVAASNGAIESGSWKIQGVEQLTQSELLLQECSSAWLLSGAQLVSKFNEQAKNTVNIYLCLFRLPQFTTDILVTFNDPVCIDPLSSSAAGFVAAVPWTLQDFQNVLQSFRLLNPGVFG
ncbi:ran guanine nucleotide release factor isoform X1 [Misgurnus anguillicaudatus]|uniref:ran guanine nucleotide release factor isoform X1 n=2 Tax=Misgurnus anguillicaudatus TaxID=75329 RepID=UPI003CCF35EC